MNILVFVLAVSALVVIVALVRDFAPEIIAEAKARREQEQFVWTPRMNSENYNTEFDARWNASRRRILFRELQDRKLTVRHGAHRRI